MFSFRGACDEALSHSANCRERCCDYYHVLLSSSPMPRGAMLCEAVSLTGASQDGLLLRCGELNLVAFELRAVLCTALPGKHSNHCFCSPSSVVQALEQSPHARCCWCCTGRASSTQASENDSFNGALRCWWSLPSSEAQHGDKVFQKRFDLACCMCRKLNRPLLVALITRRMPQQNYAKFCTMPLTPHYASM